MMGWASFLEDIQKRLDDGVERLSSPPDVKRGNTSIESLRDTNDTLRRNYDELMKLVYAVREDIEAKKQTDFCKTECIRLKDSIAKLVYRENRIDNEEQFYPPNAQTPSNRVSNPHKPKRIDQKPKNIEPTSQNVRESEQRLDDAKKKVATAQKKVATAKNDLGQANKVQKEAQKELDALINSERNSTRYITK